MLSKTGFSKKIPLNVKWKNVLTKLKKEPQTLMKLLEKSPDDKELRSNLKASYDTASTLTTNTPFDASRIFHLDSDSNASTSVFSHYLRIQKKQYDAKLSLG